MDSTYQRRPLAVRLATLLLAVAALIAATAALADRSPALAILVVACASASLFTLSVRRATPVLASVGATVLASLLWTVVEARTRHVLDLFATVAAVLAALMLARPDARAYVGQAVVEPQGVGQTSTDGS